MGGPWLKILRGQTLWSLTLEVWGYQWLHTVHDHEAFCCLSPPALLTMETSSSPSLFRASPHCAVLFLFSPYHLPHTFVSFPALKCILGDPYWSWYTYTAHTLTCVELWGTWILLHLAHTDVFFNTLGTSSSIATNYWPKSMPIPNYNVLCIQRTDKFYMEA